MNPKDLHSLVSVVQTLSPQKCELSTDSLNATGVDGSRHHAVEHIAEIGISTQTLSGSMSITVFLEDSADNNSYAVVTDESAVIGDMLTIASGILGVVDAAAEDPCDFNIGYRGTKRYSRLRFLFTGDHGTGSDYSLVAATAIKAFPRFGGTAGLLPA